MLYKTFKDNKIIAINTTKVFKFLNYDSIKQDRKHTIDDYEQLNSTGEYVLKSEYPIEIRNEQIRAERQRRYEIESDPIRLDYDEAFARGEDTAETLKAEWLASKDKIREELPYIEDSIDDESSSL